MDLVDAYQLDAYQHQVWYLYCPLYYTALHIWKPRVAKTENGKREGDKRKEGNLLVDELQESTESVLACVLTAEINRVCTL